MRNTHYRAPALSGLSTIGPEHHWTPALMGRAQYCEGPLVRRSDTAGLAQKIRNQLNIIASNLMRSEFISCSFNMEHRHHSRTCRGVTLYNTTQHNTTQHNTTQHNTTAHNSTQQHSAAQHNTTQHNTAQHNTTQHNTIQHNTTQ